MSELSHLERMVSRKLKELGVPLQSSDNELWYALSRVVAPTIYYQAAREIEHTRRGLNGLRQLGVSHGRATEAGLGRSSDRLRGNGAYGEGSRAAVVKVGMPASADSVGNIDCDIGRMTCWEKWGQSVLWA